jgi:molecular chaperone GrpE
VKRLKSQKGYGFFKLHRHRFHRLLTLSGFALFYEELRKLTSFYETKMMKHNKVDELKKMLGQNMAQSPADEALNHLATDDQIPGDTEGTALSADIDAEKAGLLAKITDLNEQLAQQQNEYLRQLAEFDNFKKRLNKEKEETVKFANEKVIGELFPVLDGLENTLSHISEEQKSDPLASGIELVLKELLQILKKHGLEEVSGAGANFDPNVHEAIASAENPDVPPGVIITTHRKGYKLKDRLIRAALVTVSRPVT